MEFFERAHVVRMRDIKPKTEQEAVKKQLKLMLQGYKTSDNKLIREAEAVDVDLDESSSVSGFSDLNLTASSPDDDPNPKQACESSITSDNDSEIDESSSKQNISQISVLSSNENSMNCITTDDNQVDTMTSVSSVNIDESLTTSNSITDDEFSSLISEDKSLNSSEDSLCGSSLSEFDPNGDLAFQIHQKLNSQKIKQKRKVTDSDPLPVNDKKSKIRKEKSHNSNNDGKDQTRVMKRDKNVEKNHSEIIYDPDKSNESPPYVSITATDLEEESFSNILGDYKHSTIRNLPSDNQSTIFTADSSAFSMQFTGDESVKNLDEVSSLIPEVDEDLSVTDLVEVDTNITFDEPSFNETSVIETDIEQANVSHIQEQYNICNVKVYYGKETCVFILRHPAEIYVHGKVLARSLSGNVEVFGHILTDKEVPIIAPHYTYAQCFKTLESKEKNPDLSNKLHGAGISSLDAKEIVEDGGFDGILVFKPLNCPKMAFVAQNFSRANLFKTTHKEKQLERAATMLGCTLYSTLPQRYFENNPLFLRVLPNNQLATKGIICGGKGSGKSTFMRYYVNQLLPKSPVLVVDLDPGQSEFTVAGSVSATVVDKPIFGPSFTHLRKPNQCLNIGIISTMDNVVRYINAVKGIFAYCDEHFPNLPWIINTMGMTNAVGLKFMTIIIAVAQPNFVLQYDSKNAKKRFDTRLSSANVSSLIQKYKYDRLFSNITRDINEYSHIMVPEAEILSSNRSSLIARDERYLTLMAYFAELVKNLDTSWLLGVTPYRVNLKDLCVATNLRLNEDCITKVLNAKVVALCQQTRPDGRLFTLADKPLLCHGHGLIRGIDWENEVLYMITPLSGDELKVINTIVYADWVPDLGGQEVHLPEGTEVPYRTAAQHKQSILMAPPKRRFNPLQLLKMTRNS